MFIKYVEVEKQRICMRKSCVCLCWRNQLQVSISATFYKQLLGTKIPKVQKVQTDDLTVFLGFLDLGA
jgi:hypothetical protein